MRISDWSSDVCSSDLLARRRKILRPAVAIAMGAVAAIGIIGPRPVAGARAGAVQVLAPEQEFDGMIAGGHIGLDAASLLQLAQQLPVDLAGIEHLAAKLDLPVGDDVGGRSEEHTSELQSLMRISYA